MMNKQFSNNDRPEPPKDKDGRPMPPPEDRDGKRPEPPRDGKHAPDHATDRKGGRPNEPQRA